KLFVQAYLLNAQGERLEESRQEMVIGREVALDLSQEEYDTRIAPTASQTFTYTQAVPATAGALRGRGVVHPGHFYERFFTALLHDHSGPGRAQLEAALQHAVASPFTVFERDVPLRRAGN